MAQQLYLTQFIIKQNLGTLCSVLAYDTSVGHFSRSRTSQERSALDLLVVCNAKCAEPTRKLLSIEAESRVNYVVLCLRVRVNSIVPQCFSHLVILMLAQGEYDHWHRLSHCRAAHKYIQYVSSIMQQVTDHYNQTSYE